MTQPPVSLVTGAGSGIGRATAIGLAIQGHSVALVGRRTERLVETAELFDDARGDDGEEGNGGVLAGNGGECVVIAGDVSVAGDANAIIEGAIEGLGGLDHLINCAGVAPAYPIDETTPARLADVFAVNAMGTGNLIAAAWPTFVQQQRGSIVNISSMATEDPFPGFFAYAASKAAVEMMAISCAKEGAEFNIRAFAVAPGAVETEMLRLIVSKEDWPTANCLTPQAVAAEIVACVIGQRDERNGQTIRLPNP